MTFQITHPLWLLALPVALGWVTWLAWKTDVQIQAWRRWLAYGLRVLVVSAVVLALAGLQWNKPQEGMNVYFLIDRSQSVPAQEQQIAHELLTTAAKQKSDKAGLMVFGTDAGIELSLTPAALQTNTIQTVVGENRTDIAGAIRLGTAAFPETGQKRLVLFSDGNENIGDAVQAVMAAKPLDVTVDVVPLGTQGGSDVSVQRLAVPGVVKKGQPFDARIFALSDRDQPAKVRLFRNDQLLGEQAGRLAKGKNLFSFPQSLGQAGFYSYEVQVEASGDSIPQNNRASGFANVRGDPRVLIVSSDPDRDAPLANALRGAKLEVELGDLSALPSSLAGLQAFDSIFLSNVNAGDLGRNAMLRIESAVRDFGVGLVCVGGDQAFAAGGYRNTPLERTLPVSMELSSKKVLPPGALVLVMHGMEFNNGNQVARRCAIGVLDAMGPNDELGVVLWDGQDRWHFPLTKVGNKQDLGRQIMGMNQGDLPSFQNVMTMGFQGLKKSTASIKHMILFSDGDPGGPSDELMASFREEKITVTTVLIAGHAGPDTMIEIAEKGDGRFYNITNPAQLPQIFLKETAVILKTAIYEEPFTPQQIAASEALSGFAAGGYPPLLGYVATSDKPRAETPLLTAQGDPLLAHWQYGLGRAVAFTSDARAKWGSQWIGWGKYQTFWSQLANWSLRRVETGDLSADVAIEQGSGIISVEAMDADGNYRNFLDLQAVIVGPKGERQFVPLKQTAAGRYDAAFETRETGAYLVHLREMENGELRSSQVIGANLDHSPEFAESHPNLARLERLAEVGSGKLLSRDFAADNPFERDRKKTFQPVDLWEWLLKFAVILFPIDVGVRRIQLDWEEWLKATANLRRLLFFWRRRERQTGTEESLASLLARRDEARQSFQRDKSSAPDPRLFQPEQPAAEFSAKPSVVAETKPEEPSQTDGGDSTTSRLLAAKRKARRRKK
ncbi:MAG: VWA domain-containing protein [Verrucomicrobia bacterium]|nr:VWA domain-containing protein [Verrucomicrobiota bacterium]